MRRRLAFRFLCVPTWCWLFFGGALLSLLLVKPEPIWLYHAGASGPGASRATQYVPLGRTADGRFFGLRSHYMSMIPQAEASYFDEIRVGPMWPRPELQGVRPFLNTRLGLTIVTGGTSVPLFEPMWMLERFHLGIQPSAERGTLPSADALKEATPSIEVAVEGAARRGGVRLPPQLLSSLRKGPYDPPQGSDFDWLGLDKVHGLWSSEWESRVVWPSVLRNAGFFLGSPILLIGIALALLPHRTMRRIRRGKGLCPECRYDLKFEFARICPECGKDPKADR